VGRIVISMGHRQLEGNYNCVMMAGELQANNSKIKKLYLAGEATIRRSNLGLLRCAGEVRMDDSNLGDTKIAGGLRLHGTCKGNSLVVVGDLSAEYLECRIIRNGSLKSMENKEKSIVALRGRPVVAASGNVHVKPAGNVTVKSIRWSGTLKAETFENHYPIDLSNCDYEFKNIISSALLTCKGELVCSNFYSFGGIQCESINAENVVIVVNENIFVQSIGGSNIRICNRFHVDSLFKSLLKSVHYSNFASEAGIVSIPTIEGDSICIEYTRSELVSGIDVKIGDLCIIDKVEYKSSIQVSPKAIVNELVRL